ncbi:MAG TPA: 4-hydroxyphenylacetate 3-hydroxylase N-terminal domain-containing protein [Streptosporangiaceae bacterium]|nr:4-hydroxyphenylacetate 3-hydroxylase N-terminal domain-containing protein [Streptosporangiaceae bacterium]
MVRTGEQYLAELRDDRDVVVNGSRVADVTRHSALLGSANSVAALMDLHHEQSTSDELMTACPETGEIIPWSYALAEDAVGVADRGRSFEIIARATGGLMGRSPDFLATLLASWHAAAKTFGQRNPQFSENVTNYYRYARQHNICHTHAISDPPRDRYLPDSGRPLTLRKTGETNAGIVVSGMKMLATLAPLAEALIVYPFRPLAKEESALALAFAVPIGTPGLRLICRDPLARGASLFDAPLSERFDEMDALCVFDDVVVPWDRVFIDGDVEMANTMRQKTDMTTYQWHQCAVRAAVKAELLFGVASLLAKESGRDRQTPTRVMLGEMAAMVESFRALVTAAEKTAVPGAGGYHVPATPPLAAFSVLSSMFFPRFSEFLQLIGSSGLIMRPSEGDLSGSAVSPLRDYFAGTDMSAEEYAALLRLAAEITVGEFGGRHLLYERFYLGPPDMLKERLLQRFDDQAAEAFVRRFLVLPGKDL